MSRTDQLLASFQNHVRLPLRSGLPLSQRVWFVVYPPEDERRVAPRLPEFELATKDAGLRWERIDMAGSFTEWMDTLEDHERGQCFADLDIMATFCGHSYLPWLTAKLESVIAGFDPATVEATVFTLTGLIEFYDFVHVSEVIESLDDRFPGILLVFFPGEREGNIYRFLGARDGWNYLALPILPETCP